MIDKKQEARSRRHLFDCEGVPSVECKDALCNAMAMIDVKSLCYNMVLIDVSSVDDKVG